MSIELLGDGGASTVNRLIQYGNRLRLGSSGARAVGYAVLSRDFEEVAARLLDNSSQSFNAERDGMRVDGFHLANPLMTTIDMVELVETFESTETGVTQVHYTVTPTAFDRLADGYGDQPVGERRGLRWKKILVDDTPLSPHIVLRDHTIMQLHATVPRTGQDG